jgi:hypothetical protein
MNDPKYSIGQKFNHRWPQYQKYMADITNISIIGVLTDTPTYMYHLQSCNGARPTMNWDIREDELLSAFEEAEPIIEPEENPLSRVIT